MEELWYSHCAQKTLLDRMNRLARRTAQQQLSFGDQEACVRTPGGMAEYVTFQAKYRKRRPVLRINSDLNLVNRGPSLAVGNPSVLVTNREVLGIHSNQYGLERSIQVVDEDVPVLPEVHFVENCVPDNPVPAPGSSSIDVNNPHGYFVDPLNLKDLSSSFGTKGRDRLGLNPEEFNPVFARDDMIGPRKVTLLLGFKCF